MLRVTPARAGYTSGKALADALGAVCVNLNKQPRSEAFVVNYGRSAVRMARGFNFTGGVTKAANKLLTFRSLPEDLMVPWTDSQEVAQEWLRGGVTTVARLHLSGRSGSGIIIVEPGDDFPVAPLYTQYMGDRRREYRVHVVGGVTMTVQKKLRNGIENPDLRIRSHDSGWVHARREIIPAPGLELAARDAISGLGLDFGAVDLAINNDGIIKVFEVNTAPGLTGMVFDFYVENLRRMIDGEIQPANV